jgi:hypothetical protein
MADVPDIVVVQSSDGEMFVMVGPFDDRAAAFIHAAIVADCIDSDEGEDIGEAEGVA